MSEMNAQGALEGAGLTPMEAKIYLELLSRGSATAGPIIKALGLHRATVYSVLQRLIERGLVSYVMRAGTRHFTAADPEGILDMVKEREEGLKAILPQLKAKAEQAKGRQAAEIYEGMKGIKSIFDGMMRRGPAKGEEYMVLGAMEDIPQAPYLNNWIKRWAGQGRPIKMLFSEGSNNERSRALARLPNMQIKYMPKPYTYPVSIGMLNDQTGIFLWTAKNPLSISIDSKEVAESFKSYFRMLWNQDVKVYRGFDDVMGRFYSMLDTMKGGEEYCVLGATYGEWRKRLGEWFLEYHRERIRRKLRVKLLYVPEAKELIHQEMTQTGDPGMLLSEVKELPHESSSPMQINLYKGGKVLMFLFGKEIMCFEIDSKVVYNNFKAYFDVLWGQETRVVKGFDAIQNIFEEALEDGQLDMIGARGYFVDERPKFIDGWEKRAIERGFTLRNIVDKETKGHRITRFPFAETRYNIPKEFSGLSVFWIYGNKVAIANWVTKKEPIVFIIENKNIYDTYKKQFELLWNQKTSWVGSKK